MILVFVVTAGLSGSAIAFWRDIDGWLNPDWYQVAATGQRKSIDKLSERVLTEFPESRIHGIILPQKRPSSLIVYLAGEPLGIDEVFVDPYTGNLLGARDTDRISLDRRHLLPFIYRLHYSLGLGERGEYLLGFVALLWLVATIIGLWLAWPRKGKWRKALSVKASAGKPRLMFDLHRAGGLLFSSFFIVIVWTGLWWNMDYVFRPVAGAILPTTPWFPETRPSVKTVIDDQGIDHAVNIARSARPRATAYYVRLMPDKALYTVYLRQPEETGPYGHTFAFIHYDGRIEHIDEPKNNRAGDSYAEWQLPLHTGQFLGMPGRLLWAIVGLIPVLLGITGIWLWLRKSMMTKNNRIKG